MSANKIAQMTCYYDDKKIIIINDERESSEYKYLAEIPEINGITQSDTFEGAIAMAQDYINTYNESQKEKGPMELERAMDIINTSQPGGHHSKPWLEAEIIEARLVILNDVYQFLESENYHTGITVIEKLTGIEYN
ncbi:type II toxin-antitoxin system HicB family antitoxin [Herbiconiux daphne]|uniref:Type II toxin-antitoxin system HicB family antitoxin n=1 Tax=Herbiconiux daphne TaxID=2970914 RepID=A0ABT2HBN3_9MICO|nr:hypothetical protein [Herbiconiux daphne]MCS5737343.1 hypothetical protein [Herbiconiux daphne]